MESILSLRQWQNGFKTHTLKRLLPAICSKQSWGILINLINQSESWKFLCPYRASFPHTTVCSKQKEPESSAWFLEHSFLTLRNLEIYKIMQRWQESNKGLVSSHGLTPRCFDRAKTRCLGWVTNKNVFCCCCRFFFFLEYDHRIPRTF